MGTEWQPFQHIQLPAEACLVEPEFHRQGVSASDIVLRTLVNSVSGYLYSVQYCNGAAISVYHSPQCAHLTGYTAEEYRDNSYLWITMVYPDDREAVLKYFADTKRLLEGKPLEHRIIRKTGEVRWVSNHCTVTLDVFGKVERMDGFLIDITEHKKLEDGLRKAKEEAEAAIKQKDKFVSLLSHDLRAPIASLIGFIRVLGNENAGSYTGEQKKVIDIMGNISGHMLKMIDELLSISRLKTGRFQLRLRFVNACSIVSGVMESLSFEANKKKVDVVNRLEPSLRLYADPDLLWEVVQNLVSNAIKFCNSGGQVVVSTPPGRRTVIAVRDSGIGIPKDLLPHLFSYEVKTSSTGTMGEKGTGLGLPLSQDIMAAHNGKLTVESEEGKGSTFFAEFPQVRPVVLYVDDDGNNHALISRYLQSLEMELLHASHGGEALKMLAQRKVHLVISDFMMPVLDGFGLLRSLRASYATKTMPFIMITSSQESHLCQKALDDGADDFLYLPVTERELVPRVRRFTV